MYLDHYGFKKKPFEQVSDPGFIWVSKENAEALQKFKLAFLYEEGYLVISGDDGVGKNALMTYFLKY